MRRRQVAGRPSSAAEMVRLWAEAKDEARVLCSDPEDRRRFVAGRLAEHGVDVMDAIRARRALRGR